MKLHRNGILRLIFQKIQAPDAVPRPIAGSLQSVVVDRRENLKLDSVRRAPPHFPCWGGLVAIG